MRIYKQLEIWRKAMDIVTDVYLLTAELPGSERYSLMNQMRRSALSIPSNIAEGCSGSDKAFRYYLRIALGSGYELETQLTICIRLNYLPEEMVHGTSKKLEALLKMINSFHSHLTIKNP